MTHALWHAGSGSSSHRHLMPKGSDKGASLRVNDASTCTQGAPIVVHVSRAGPWPLHVALYKREKQIGFRKLKPKSQVQVETTTVSFTPPEWASGVLHVEVTRSARGAENAMNLIDLSFIPRPFVVTQTSFWRSVCSCAGRTLVLMLISSRSHLVRFDLGCFSLGHSST